MNDIKNILLAWTSSSFAVVAAIETKTIISLISAIVLPMLFFAIGKAIDIAVQIHFRRLELERKSKEQPDE